MSKVCAVLPARYASTRLPGKPLLADTGKAMICHVVDAVKQAKLVDTIIVATDDERIKAAVEAEGGRAVMTREDHPNGTCRIAEAIEDLGGEYDLILNVQGDEPEIEAEAIDALVQRMRDGDEVMGTVASPFAEGEDASNPNIVKVVMNKAGQAMYFSRSLIPHDRDGDQLAQAYKHLGLYAYRRDFLQTYIGLDPTPCEQSEKLEQLRVLENCYSMAVITMKLAYNGIDTPEQYAAFVERFNSRV